MKPFEYVSPSSMSTFERCPRSWRQRFFTSHRPPPGYKAEIGTVFHETAEAWLATDWGVGETFDGSIDVSAYTFVAYLRHNLSSFLKSDDPDVVASATELMAVSHDWAKEFLERNKHKVLIGLELEGNADPVLQGVPLKGIIDVLMCDTEKFEYNVIDFKTGNWVDGDIKNNLQARCYALLVEMWKADKDPAFGHDSLPFGQMTDASIAVDFEYVRSGRVPGHSFSTAELIETQEEISNTYKEMLAVYESHDEPETQLNNLCGWCDYKLTCPELSKDDTVVFLADDDELVEIYARAKFRASLAASALADVTAAVEGRFIGADITAMQSENSMLTYRAGGRNVVNTDLLAKEGFLPEQISPPKVSITALRKHLQGLGMDKVDVDNIITNCTEWRINKKPTLKLSPKTTDSP